jgi:hypothetical protein
MKPVALLLFLLVLPSARAEPPSGDAVIRAKAGPSEIVITTTTRVAGAIHSLTWSGKEFVDSHDHGRQIQSASNFDCNRKFIPEVFNPTEAGSMADSAGPTSTSRLLRLEARGNELTTRTQMAFWLKPGEKSRGNPALNDRPLSDHMLEKRVRIGYKGLPHAIEYDVTFTVPKGEHHTFAQFEALTGYMPWDFRTFWAFDAKINKLVPLPLGQGEQRDPVVLARADGKYAMGIYSPGAPGKGYERIGYGRWAFEREKVTKWNCVYRIRDPKGVPAGEYKFRCFVVVGSLSDCEATLAVLMAMKE